MRPIPRAPRDTETAFELPWRLQISPNPNGGFAHRTDAVEQAGASSCGTRGSACAPSQGDVVEIDEDQKTYRTVRAIWTRDHDRFPFQPDPAPEGASRTRTVRTTTPDVPDVAELARPDAARARDVELPASRDSGDAWTPPAVDVDRLMLTSLGGWLSSPT